ncbi:hypothetical protein F4820DRAFT_428976 [Hypoxylon rubiginosum]|uniref:Uncharacterized protein n=1 Tax=Hypoxylon rubiginosum TaxID=110542 RepID=A0ACB9YU91_9PEZI|nr:hypothetical protein F4820DRAFT_428976 [Hypoxylon rubiginosum]
MWTESSVSWLWSEFKELYTPTEDMLILSSAFSIVVSVILEALTMLVLRHKLKRTKLWLRYMLYTIFSANSVLAFVAFLYTSPDDHMLDEGPSGYITTGKQNIYPGEDVLNMETWGVGVAHVALDESGSRCGRWVVSRSLSLLISIFSTVLLLTAWMDFREQDRRELYYIKLSEEPLEEKDGFLDV